MAIETVKWFTNDKGYGFITPDEPGKDLFAIRQRCSARATARWPTARVSYEAEATAKGPLAVNVQRL